MEAGHCPCLVLEGRLLGLFFTKMCIRLLSWQVHYCQVNSLSTTECTYYLAETLLCTQLARVLCIFQQGSTWTGRPQPLTCLPHQQDTWQNWSEPDRATFFQYWHAQALRGLTDKDINNVLSWSYGFQIRADLRFIGTLRDSALGEGPNSLQTSHWVSQSQARPAYPT